MKKVETTINHSLISTAFTVCVLLVSVALSAHAQDKQTLDFKQGIAPEAEGHFEILETSPFEKYNSPEFYFFKLDDESEDQLEKICETLIQKIEILLLGEKLKTDDLECSPALSIQLHQALMSIPHALNKLSTPLQYENQNQAQTRATMILHGTFKKHAFRFLFKQDEFEGYPEMNLTNIAQISRGTSFEAPFSGSKNNLSGMEIVQKGGRGLLVKFEDLLGNFYEKSEKLFKFAYKKDGTLIQEVPLFTASERYPLRIGRFELKCKSKTETCEVLSSKIRDFSFRENTRDGTDYSRQDRHYYQVFDYQKISKKIIELVNEK